MSFAPSFSAAAGIFLVLELLVATPLSAQIVWDAPALMRPGAPSGLSIYLMEAHPSDELGVLVGWRGSAAPTGIGFRAGLADDASGDLAAFAGFDVSGSLTRLEGAGDPAVLWWSGAGLGIGDEVAASVPLGIVFGWQGSDEGLTIMPYAGGHAVLDIVSGPGDDLDFDAAVDLGLDLGFRSGLMARFGASIGDRDAFAIGVRLPG